MTLASLKTAWAGWPGRVLRVALAILPVLWIARFVDLRRVVAAAGSLSVGSWVLAFVSANAGIVIGAVRWRMLLRTYGAVQPPSVLGLYRHYLIGAYYNLLPSGVAGDLARGYRVRACLGGSVGATYTVILVDRVAGFTGLLGIAVIAMAAGPRLPDSTVLDALDLGAAAACGAALLFLVLPYLLSRSERLRSLTGRIPVAGRIMLRVPPARSLGVVAAAVGLSFLTQTTAVYATYIIAHALSSHATLIACARVVPFIFLLTYVPLTPAGVGQREMLTAFFFGFVGVSTEDGVAIGLLCFAVTLATAGVGAVCYLLERVLGWGREREPDGQPSAPGEER
jgi:glycosyltransferase 2 family protein